MFERQYDPMPEMAGVPAGGQQALALPGLGPTHGFRIPALLMRLGDGLREPGSGPTTYSQYQAQDEQGENMDPFDFFARTAPLLIKVWDRISIALSADRRDRIHEAERLRHIGDEQYKEGCYDLAIFSYRESLRLNSHDMVTGLHLVRAYRASNQISEALVAAGGVLVLMDTPFLQSRIWSVIGQCNYDSFERSGSREDLKSTVKAFDRASKLDPYDVIPHWMLLATILPVLERSDSLAGKEGLDLQSQAENAVNDLIRLLRKSSGNAAEYADSIAAGARELLDTIRLSEYWSAQLETVATHTAALSPMEVLRIEPSHPRRNTARKVVFSSFVFLMVITLAFLAVGCSIDGSGLLGASLPATQAQNTEKPLPSTVDAPVERNACTPVDTNAMDPLSTTPEGVRSTSANPDSSDKGRVQIEHKITDNVVAVPINTACSILALREDEEMSGGHVSETSDGSSAVFQSPSGIQSRNVQDSVQLPEIK